MLLSDIAPKTALELPILTRVRSQSRNHHRTPARLTSFIADCEQGQVEVIIAAAGMAAHLAGGTAAHALIAVLGVPLDGSSLNGLDALLYVLASHHHEAGDYIRDYDEFLAEFG